MFIFQFKLRRQRAIRRIARLSGSTMGSRLKILLLRLFVILALHTLFIAWWEDLSLRESIWLTLTTVTTVGYGDVSAATPLGQAATIILIYFMGIWMLAQLAGEYLEYRAERKDRILKGLWSWKDMHDHIVIVNAPESNATTYLDRLVSQFRATPQLVDKPVVLVSTLFPNGLPRSLVDQGLAYKHANTSLGTFYDDVNIAQACYVVFLSQDENDPRSDSITLDLLDQFQRTHENRLILAEAVQDSNIERFRKLGADSVIRPVRAYPELIARALGSPGTEYVLEDLFGYFGASLHRYDVDIENKEWQSVVCSLVRNGLGIALGYIDKVGVVQTCPRENVLVQATALLVMAHDKAVPSQKAIENALASC